MSICMRILPIGLIVSLWSHQGLAAVGDGQELHDQNCVSCHNSEIYTREDRKVGSLTALESQVRRCETALGLRWFDEDITTVTGFLNEQFYRFEP